MSTLNVDKVDPSSGTALELGTSGDTINIPSGVTIANSGTATGFGAALTGSTNNQVTTVTAANAIQGETNLIYDGTILGCGATGSAADLGVGIHIRTADSGGSVDGASDELVIEGSGSSGMTILSGTSGEGGIKFGDSGDNDAGRIVYDHSTDNMLFLTSGNTQFTITDDGRGISEFTALAWVRVDQTGSQGIDDSQNVSSISDDGAGKTTVNFDNNMANANYSITMCSENNSYQGTTSASTSAFAFAIANSSASYEDRLRVSAVVYGTQ